MFLFTECKKSFISPPVKNFVLEFFKVTLSGNQNGVSPKTPSHHRRLERTYTSEAVTLVQSQNKTTVSYDFYIEMVSTTIGSPSLTDSQHKRISPILLSSYLRS